MIEINQIYCGDCLELMKQIQDRTVDLIITSPPYEDISGAGYSAKNKDILFFKLYSEFIDNFFSQAHRILKSTGQLFFNVKHKTHNKSLRSVHWLEFLDSFQRFIFKSYIIWKYSGSFDSTKARFHLDYEVIYHLACSDNIYLNENCGIDDPLSSIWYIPHNISKEKRVHPTQMPIALADRIIKIASKENDLILDPFCGSGTTCISAKNLNRNWIGFEINPKYCGSIKN